jgi:hypothetical protein
MTFVNPLISNAFDHIFGEVERSHLANALFNAVLNQCTKLQLAVVEDADYLVSEGYFMQSGCTQDPILYYGVSQEGRKMVIQVDVQHLYPGMDKCRLSVTDKLLFRLKEGEKIKQDAEVVFLAFCTFSIQGAPNLAYHHIRDEKRRNDYHFVWVNLNGFGFQVSNPKSDLEEWVWFILHAHECKRVPGFISCAAVLEAFEVARFRNWSALDKKWYMRYEQEFKERLLRMKEGLMKAGVRLNPAYFETPSSAATLNLNLLPMGLGIYPAREIKPSEINIDGYTHRRGTAFGLFRLWAEKYKELYGTELVIKDETPLVGDFENALREAIQLLYQDETFVSSGLKPELGSEFVVGVIEMLLSQTWYVEYVLKRQPDYKSVQAIQAILEYFEEKPTSEIEVESLYESQLFQLSNFEGVSKQIHFDTVSAAKQLGQQAKTGKKGQVRNVLLHILGNYIQQISNATKNVPVIVKGAYSCFDMELLRTAIKDNHDLFTLGIAQPQSA